MTFKITAEEKEFILSRRALAAAPVTTYIDILKRVIKVLSNKKFQTEYKELVKASKKALPSITKGLINQITKFIDKNSPPTPRMVEKWPELFKTITQILGKGYMISVRPDPAHLNVLLKGPEKRDFVNFLKGKTT